MCPSSNEVFKFVNAGNLLIIFVCSNEKGLTCSARGFFMQAYSFYPHLHIVNYRINFQIFHALMTLIWFSFTKYNKYIANDM